MISKGVLETIFYHFHKCVGKEEFKNMLNNLIKVKENQLKICQNDGKEVFEIIKQQNEEIIEVAKDYISNIEKNQKLIGGNKNIVTLQEKNLAFYLSIGIIALLAIIILKNS